MSSDFKDSYEQKVYETDMKSYEYAMDAIVRIKAILVNRDSEVLRGIVDRHQATIVKLQKKYHFLSKDSPV